MTNEEIIEHLKSWMEDGDGRFFFDKEEADKIIEALELQIALEDGGEIMPPCR